MRWAGLLLFAAWLLDLAAGEAVTTAAALVAAVRDGADGSAIVLGPGTYELDAPLEPRSGMTITGAGADRTILTHVAGWKPSTATLPDPEIRLAGLDSRAYLVRCHDRSTGITISGMTLRCPQLHGAIFAFENRDLHLHHLCIEHALWCGIRTLGMKGARIHDCTFSDAGGRWKRGGQPGTDGGVSGAGIFATWMSDSDIADNRFLRTGSDKAGNSYGVKGRQARRCRIHGNTLAVNFSIELPFEVDEDVEIDHNDCHGAISIPKFGGGPVPASGCTFHIHHNCLRSGYAIEFVRNGVEIDHNLFLCDPAKDGGNCISAFGQAPARGPASFHDNMVANPGRGVMWIKEVFDHLEICNNCILATTTATPRSDGLFGFNPGCDFSTIAIRNNRIECRGLSRPLLRNRESQGALIVNNQLINVADAAAYANAPTGARIGPDGPLRFVCGVAGETAVDDWTAAPAPASASTPVPAPGR